MSTEEYEEFLDLSNQLSELFPQLTKGYDDNGNIIPLCKVAGLTEDFKTELRDNFDEWYMCPLTIGGMMVSTAQAESDGSGISIRHPYIKSIRKNDIDPKDCTLSKILS